MNDQYKTSDGKLIRVLSSIGKGKTTDILINDQLPFTPGPDGEYQLGTQLTVAADNAHIETRDGKAFLKLAPGTSTTLTYSWN